MSRIRSVLRSRFRSWIRWHIAAGSAPAGSVPDYSPFTSTAFIDRLEVL